MNVISDVFACILGQRHPVFLSAQRAWVDGFQGNIIMGCPRTVLVWEAAE